MVHFLDVSLLYYLIEEFMGWQPPHEFFDEVVQKTDIEEMNHGTAGFVS